MTRIQGKFTVHRGMTDHDGWIRSGPQTLAALVGAGNALGFNLKFRAGWADPISQRAGSKFRAESRQDGSRHTADRQALLTGPSGSLSGSGDSDSRSGGAGPGGQGQAGGSAEPLSVQGSGSRCAGRGRVVTACQVAGRAARAPAAQ